VPPLFFSPLRGSSVSSVHLQAALLFFFLKVGTQSTVWISFSVSSARTERSFFSRDRFVPFFFPWKKDQVQPLPPFLGNRSTSFFFGRLPPILSLTEKGRRTFFRIAFYCNDPPPSGDKAPLSPPWRTLGLYEFFGPALNKSPLPIEGLFFPSQFVAGGRRSRPPQHQNPFFFFFLIRGEICLPFFGERWRPLSFLTCSLLLMDPSSPLSPLSRKKFLRPEP